MCVGYAAKITSAWPAEKCVEVECQGIRAIVSAALLRDFAAGDYVLVHAGVALDTISQEVAEEIMAIQEELEKNDDT